MKTPWTVQDIPSLAGRTAVVTGTGGIGYECGLALAGAGATVIFAGRNPAKGANAVSKVLGLHPSAAVRFELLDLASLASVHAFAERLRSSERKVDILINNAAVMALPKRQTTQDGFEMQFGTNHLGHFALTLLLLPLLRASDAPRVVTVSSTANRIGRMRFDDLQAERRYSPMWGAYAQSKVANILFAAELQRRADAAGIPLTSNSAHPGFSSTDIIANGPGEGGPLSVFNKLLRPFFIQSAAHGALPELYAATAPEARGFEYYGPRDRFELRGPVGRAKIGRRAGNAVDAKRLWEISEQLTGVSFAAASAT